MVYVHLANGFEEIEALTVVDLLRRAEIPVKTVSIEDKVVVGAHNIPVTADLLFKEADYENCTMIVLPGGMLGTVNLENHQGLSEVIDEFYKKKKYISAICAAPMILGHKGYLNNKIATIYPGMEDELGNIMEHSKDKVARDGHIITGRGPGCAMAFALAIIEILKGHDKMLEIKTELVY